MGWDGISLGSQDGTDFYSFHLDSGDSVTVAASEIARSGLTLNLLDGAGNVLANTVSDAANVDFLISEFVAPATGTYYVRLTASPSGADYSLVLTRNAVFDTEMNNDPEHAQNITQTGVVLGDVGHAVDRLFVAGWYDYGHFFEVDPLTGEKIRDLGLPFLSSGMYAFGGAAATESSVLVAGADINDHITDIYEISTRTGHVIRTIANPTGSIINGMAFLNNEMYVTTDPYPRRMFVLDYYTGQLERSFVFSNDVYSLGASRDTLYGMSGSTLYEIDPITGQITLIGTLSGTDRGLGVLGEELVLVGQDDTLEFFDLETLAHTRTLSGNYCGPRGIAADAGIVEDYYSVDVNAGDTLVLTTMTPAGGPGLFVNELDPMLELYDPSGVRVAWDDNSGADGRNALITYLAGTSGIYTIRTLAAVGTSGEYVLHVTGNTTAGETFAVRSTDPADGLCHETAPTQLKVIFSDLVLLTTLEASDLTVDGVAATGVTMLDGRTAVFNLPPFLGGTHNVQIALGAVTDLQGTPITAFSMQIPVGTFDFPVPLDRVEPYGSQVFCGSATGTISPAHDTNVYAIRLDSGQRLTVVATPTTGGLQPMLTLLGPGGVLLASGQASASGSTALLQGIAVDTAGVYTVVVGGVSSTTGDFELKVMLNAAAEQEANQGTLNNNASSAQDLSGAFRVLPSGGDMAGVVGRLAGDSDNFNSGTLDGSWTTYGDAVALRSADYWNTVHAYEGVSLWMWGDASVKEAVWTVNVAGLAAPVLTFWHTDTLPVPAGPFRGHQGVTGVSFSTDGVWWYPLWSTPDQTDPAGWKHYTMDLASAASSYGVNLTADVQIKFQLSQQVSSVGWDCVAIGSTSPDEDWYALPIAAGRATTLTLNGFKGCLSGLELYDAVGALVATGQTGPTNVDRAIRGFVPPDAGTGYVRVTGPADSEYLLVIVRGAVFDIEPNDAPGSAQDITNAGVGIGYVYHGANPVAAESEPNNTLGTSDDLSGSFVCVGGNVYQTTIAGVVGGSDRYDWCGFQASPGDTLRVTGGVFGWGYSYVYIYDCKGKQLAQLWDATDFTSFSYAGAYYLCAQYDVSTQRNYAMTVQLTTPHLLGANQPDTYSISVNAGDVIVAHTLTPGDGVGEPVNLLDPRLDLYDPHGLAVASDDDGAADGRNASLRHTATETGVYVVRVSGAEYNEGDYVLYVDIQDPVGVSMTPADLSHDHGLEESGPLAGTATGAAFIPLISFDGTDAAVSVNTGTIGTGLEPEAFTFDLETGQRVSVVARPGQTGATLSLEMVGVTGPVSASGPGGEVVLSGVLIAVDGTYEFHVTSDVQTAFTLDVYRNALVETGDTADTRELDLDTGMVVVDAARRWYATVGSSDPIVTVDEYVLDLSGLAGSTVSILLKGVGSADMTDARVDLIGTDGTTVEASSARPVAGEYDQVILDVLVPSGGVYTARMSGRTSGEYVLAVDSRGVMDLTPPVVTGVKVNGQVDRSVSSVVSSTSGLTTIEVVFSEWVYFTADDVTVQKVTFPAGVETPGTVLVPQGVTGFGTNVMTITLSDGVAVGTWLKVRIEDTAADLAGNRLDGEPAAGGSGRGYLYSATKDVPSGDGVPGGDAIFYVGSCIGDCSGDGKVNIFDAFALNQAWGSVLGDAKYNANVDFTRDGKVNIFDAFQLNSHWGNQLDALPTSLGGMGGLGTSEFALVEQKPAGAPEAEPVDAAVEQTEIEPVAPRMAADGLVDRSAKPQTSEPVPSAVSAQVPTVVAIPQNDRVHGETAPHSARNVRMIVPPLAEPASLMTSKELPLETAVAPTAPARRYYRPSRGTRMEPVVTQPDLLVGAELQIPLGQ